MSTLGYDYGGWIAERTIATDSTPAKVRLFGWMVTTGLAFTCIGTGGELSAAHLQGTQVQYGASTYDAAEVEVVRTPAESLMRIREVLNPAVSDLATTLGVSRQSVYNWLNGMPVAEENASRLEDLAQAADVLAHADISVNSALLKRKFASGKTLMEVAKAGESARAAALILVEIHQRETVQRARMNARFANRAKGPASADFDLPHSNEQA